MITKEQLQKELAEAEASFKQIEAPLAQVQGNLDATFVAIQVYRRLLEKVDEEKGEE